MPDNYMQWPLNANQNDIFTSDYGKSWVFDGCGWVSTCCPTAAVCNPEKDGISVIYVQKKAGLTYGYGVSYFTWNGNLNRYEGFIEVPMVIEWTGSQWKLVTSFDAMILATSPTSNILEAIWTNLPQWKDGDRGIVQIECGLIYNQLCVDTTYLITLPKENAIRGPFTLYPETYASIQDIIDGVQSIRYNGMDSNGYDIYLYYSSGDAAWYLDDGYGNSWTISAAPNQNALILGSDWMDQNGQVTATFTQGECATECYPERDGITLMYSDGNGWTPIYLTWDPAELQYYTDNQYINELFGWDSLVVYFDTFIGYLRVSYYVSGNDVVIATNNYSSQFYGLFNHEWDNPNIDIYCGNVGCTRICAMIDDGPTTMVPYYYSTMDNLITCSDKFTGWIGWNGSTPAIYFYWNDAVPSGYTLDIGGNGQQDIGVNSYTAVALIANSPYTYNQNGVTYIVTLTSGDC